MSKGYNGKILRVDLSEGKVWTEEPEELIYRTHLGGAGLAVQYLLKELPQDVDPLSPYAAAKSLLTGGHGEAEASGWWEPEPKRAGYDAIIVKGRASLPIHLWSDDREAEIRESSKAWNMIADLLSRDTLYMADKYKENLDTRVKQWKLISRENSLGQMSPNTHIGEYQGGYGTTDHRKYYLWLYNALQKLFRFASRSDDGLSRPGSESQSEDKQIRPLILLYSANAWLAYIIQQIYYNEEHYVWATDHLAPKSPWYDYTMPASSCPRRIYRILAQAVSSGDLHCTKIQEIKVGILKGAAHKRGIGVINEEQEQEIASIVDAAQVSDFRPLVYLIPFTPEVAKIARKVSVRDRAHPLSVEYVIESLPRRYFHIIELD